MLKDLFELNWGKHDTWSITHLSAFRLDKKYIINNTNEYGKFDLLMQEGNRLLLLDAGKTVNELKELAEKDLKKRIILKIG